MEIGILFRRWTKATRPLSPSLPLRLRNRKSCCNLYISAPSRGMMHQKGYGSRSPSSCPWWLHGCTGCLPADMMAEPLLIDSVDCLARRAARWTMRRPTGQTTLGGANSPGMNERNAEGRRMRICNYVFIPRAGIRLSRRTSSSNLLA